MRRGITLVELLVVIGILAVLFGIVYTITAPARRKAKLMACMRNMQQISVALKLYREDWGGRPLREGMPLSYWAKPDSWWKLGLPPDEALLPQLGYIDSKAFKCPDFKGMLYRSVYGDYNYIPFWAFSDWLYGESLSTRGIECFPQNLAKHGGKTIILYCLHHHDPARNLRELRFPILMPFIRLDGRVGLARVWRTHILGRAQFLGTIKIVHGGD